MLSAVLVTVLLAGVIAGGELLGNQSYWEDLGTSSCRFDGTEIQSFPATYDSLIPTKIHYICLPDGLGTVTFCISRTDAVGTMPDFCETGISGFTCDGDPHFIEINSGRQTSPTASTMFIWADSETYLNFYGISPGARPNRYSTSYANVAANGLPTTKSSTVIMAYWFEFEYDTCIPHCSSDGGGGGEQQQLLCSGGHPSDPPIDCLFGCDSDSSSSPSCFAETDIGATCRVSSKCVGKDTFVLCDAAQTDTVVSTEDCSSDLFFGCDTAIRDTGCLLQTDVGATCSSVSPTFCVGDDVQVDCDLDTGKVSESVVCGEGCDSETGKCKEKGGGSNRMSPGTVAGVVAGGVLGGGILLVFVVVVVVVGVILVMKKRRAVSGKMGGDGDGLEGLKAELLDSESD